MPVSSVSRWAFLQEAWLSLFRVAAGRLYPTLKAPSVELTGKIAIVTGANSGIGLQIALDLARLNATVYLACRNQSKAEDAVSQIISSFPASAGRVKTLSLDTASFSSVQHCATQWGTLSSRIDILVHNAGIDDGHGQRLTADGFPTIYATNFLGSFLLTYLLEQHLSKDARVILTTSTAQYSGSFTSDFSLTSVKDDYEPGFHEPAGLAKAPPSAGYANSKAMQVAFAKLLTQRWDRQAKESGTSNEKIAHAFSPGFTFTPIFARSTGSFFDDPLFWLLRMGTWAAVPVQQGALTGVWLASSNDKEVIGVGLGGGYWDRMTRRLSKVDLLKQETLDRMWIRWEADAGIEWR